MSCYKNCLNFRNVLLVVVITIIDVSTNSTYLEKIALKSADKNEIGLFTHKGV